MDLALVGLLLIAVGILLLGNVRANREMARQSLGAGLSSVSDLEALFGMVRGQVGPELFAHRAGLQGTLECDTPLLSELSSEPCAAFRYQVKRRWEEHVEERDAHGHRVTRTRTGSTSWPRTSAACRFGCATTPAR